MTVQFWGGPSERDLAMGFGVHAAQRLSVPDQKPLRIGTLNAILREMATAKGVTREEIFATL